MINPHISESERREFFTESEEESDEESEVELGSPAKRKFTPWEDTVEFLRSVTDL